MKDNTMARRRKKNPKHYGKSAAIGAVIGGVVGGLYQHWREPPRYVARWTDLRTAEISNQIGTTSIPISTEQISASADRADRMDFWHEVVQTAVIGAIAGVAYTGVKS